MVILNLQMNPLGMQSIRQCNVKTRWTVRQRSISFWILPILSRLVVHPLKL